MSKNRVTHFRLIHPAYTFLILFLSLVFISSCSNLSSLTSQLTTNDFQLAEVLFKVTLPEDVTADAKVMLEIVDDVTGVYFNAARYEMVREDAAHYSLRIPLKISTEVKYRYVRVSSETDYERTAEGEPVRFRIARLDGPRIIEDIVAAWSENTLDRKVGRITGQVIDQVNNAPIPNLLISVGGKQVITASDGSFIVNQLVPGVHNLVIYSMDGSYETFQQGALIAEGASTPVLVYLKKRPTTLVRFEVTLPRDHPKEMPLRFISNLSNLGNAYADLSSGSAGSAVNYPTMIYAANNRYFIELELPVGLHLRYKYSFGDGFWNTELSNDGSFITRDLVIQEGMVMRDRVMSFSYSQIAPVKITVKVPDATPANEKVYIQFKPFDWTEPLPMVSRGSGIWEFTLYSPLHFTDSLEYRYCRNGLCEISVGETSGPTTLAPLPESRTITNTVVEWSGLSALTVDSTEYLAFEALGTRPGFMAGVEFAPAYAAGWRATITSGLNFSQQLGGDFVILSPTWTTSSSGQPYLSIAPGEDLQWHELVTMINHVTISGQRTFLYPQVNYTQGAINYYSSDLWSEEFKTTWYEQYQRFLFHHADLAQLMATDALVITEPSAPYIEVGQHTVDTGRVPRALSDEHWGMIITGLRQRFEGKLIGVVTISASNTYIPTWLDQVDMVYVLLSPSLEIKQGSVSEIRRYFDTILDTLVKPIVSVTDQPVLIGISYPSSEQAIYGMLTSNAYQLISPGLENQRAVDLEIQAKIYSAAIQSSAARDWITGFISRGFFPYAELQDSSSSIYQKPSSEIVWFWYHFLLNKAP